MEFKQQKLWVALSSSSPPSRIIYLKSPYLHVNIGLICTAENITLFVTILSDQRVHRTRTWNAEDMHGVQFTWQTGDPLFTVCSQLPAHLPSCQVNNSSRRPIPVVCNWCGTDIDVADHHVRSEFSKWTSAVCDTVPMIIQEFPVN